MRSAHVLDLKYTKAPTRPSGASGRFALVKPGEADSSTRPRIGLDYDHPISPFDPNSPSRRSVARGQWIGRDHVDVLTDRSTSPHDPLNIRDAIDVIDLASGGVTRYRLGIAATPASWCYFPSPSALRALSRSG